MSTDPTDGTIEEILRQTEIEKQDIEIERTKRNIREIREELNDDAIDVLVDIIETKERAERARSKALAVEMIL